MRHTAALWRVAAVRGATVAWSSVLFKAFSRLMREDPSLFLCCVSADCPPLFLHTPLQRTDHTHCCPEAARRRRANWFEKKVCDKEKGGKVIESRCRDRSLHFILLSSGSHYFPRGLKPCRGNCLWGIFDWFKEREGVFSGLGLKVRWRIEVSGRLSCVSMHVQMNTCDL